MRNKWTEKIGTSPKFERTTNNPDVWIVKINKRPTKQTHRFQTQCSYRLDRNVNVCRIQNWRIYTITQHYKDKKPKLDTFGEVMAFFISDFQFQLIDNKLHKITEIKNILWQQIKCIRVTYRTQKNERNWKKNFMMDH